MAMMEPVRMREELTQSQSLLVGQVARVFGFDENLVRQYVMNPPQERLRVGSLEYNAANLALKIREFATENLNFRAGRINNETMAQVIGTYFTSRSSGNMDQYSFETSIRGINRSAGNLGIINPRNENETEVFRINLTRYVMVREVNPQLADLMLPTMVNSYPPGSVPRPDLAIDFIRELGSRATILPNPDGGRDVVIDTAALRESRHAFLAEHRDAVPRRVRT